MHARTCVRLAVALFFVVIVGSCANRPTDEYPDPRQGTSARSVLTSGEYQNIVRLSDAALRYHDIPHLRLPLPNPSALYSIEPSLLGFHQGNDAHTTLGATDKLLAGALRRHGYEDLRYFYVAGGFAMVTRLERIDSEFRSVARPADRWSTDIYNDKIFTLEQYMDSLLQGPRGTFRVIVFVVHPFADPAAKIIKAEEVLRWPDEGSLHLPTLIADQHVTRHQQCDVLIYVFRKTSKGITQYLDTPPGKHHIRPILTALRANGS